MIVPTMRTWVTGEVVTAAEMNSNIRDAANFLLQTPHTQAYVAAAQNHTSSGNWQAVTLDGIQINNDSMTSGGTTWSVVTTGTYQFSGGVVMAAGTVGSPAVRGMGYAVSTAGNPQVFTEIPSSATISAFMVGPVEYQHLVGGTDTIQLKCYQGSGANLAYTTGVQTYMAVRWVSNA